MLRMLDRETLRKIRRIQIRTRVILESGIGGAYHAVFKGRGMEFAEVREYEPGDDVRTIDWNVTARMGAPYVKKFVEERDLTLLLLVDVSGSQAFGSQFLAEARLRRRARGRARLLRGGQPRPGGRRALLGPHRGLRAAGPRAATTRCASCATCWRSSRGAAAPTSRARCASPSGCCGGAASWPSSPTSRPRATSGRSASCAGATTWWPCTSRDPREAEVPDGRARGPHSIPRPASGVVADTARPEVRRALRLAPSRRGAPRCSRRRGSTPSRSRTGESYERPLPAFFKARERRR